MSSSSSSGAVVAAAAAAGALVGAGVALGLTRALRRKRVVLDPRNAPGADGFVYNKAVIVDGDRSPAPPCTVLCCPDLPCPADTGLQVSHM